MGLHSYLFERMDVVLERKDERAKGTCDMEATLLDKVLALRRLDHTPFRVQLTGWTILMRPAPTTDIHTVGCVICIGVLIDERAKNGVCQKESGGVPLTDPPHTREDWYGM